MRFLLKSQIVFILSVLLLTSCSAEVDDKQLVESAKQYIEKNQLREATLELKNALQANPKNAEARYLLGELNITFGDMASAAKEYRKAQEAGWDEAASQVGLFSALVQGREFEKVLDDIQIKEEYPSNTRAELYGLKAFAEAASGYTGLAKESLKQGAALDKDAFNVLKTSIQLDIAGNRSDLAAEKIEHALSLYDNNTDLLLLASYLAMQNKDDVAAAGQFQKVISLEPENLVINNSRKARLGLARIEIINKNLDHAKDLLAPIFRQSKNDPEANYIGGMLSFQQADFDLAEERLLKVLKYAPEHSKTHLLFGAVNFSQKDYEQAAYYLGKYLNKEPGNAGARKLLGRTYILMGQQKEAQATLRPGLSDSEDDAELLALVGLSELKAGDIASGVTDLEKAVTAAPDSKALRGELARAYISAGETEKAINQIDEILAAGGNKNQAEVLKVSAYLHAQQYDKAINLVLELHERQSQDVTVMTLAGSVFAASGDKVEARKYFTMAVDTEPDNVQAGMLLAGLEEVDGNIEKAEAIYKKFSKADIESIDPQMALARLAEQRKDYEKMILWLDEANTKAPLDIRPKKVLAEYYLRNDQFDKADALIKAALDISSNDLSLLLLKSRLLVGQQRYNEALSPLNELITRSPKSVFARSILGETYLALDQLDDARRQTLLVLKEQPYYVPALLVMARLEIRASDYEQAFEYILRAQKIQPDQYRIYELGGDISILAENYEVAINYYKKAMSLKPGSELMIKTAEAFNRMAQPDQAIDLLRDWLVKNPDDVRARQFLGSAYLNNGDHKEAIQTFEAVYAVQPENIVALNNLAWTYSLDNDDRALGFAEKAYNIRPEDSGVQDTYGWILVQQGKVEKGRRILKQAASALPGVPEVQYHYAVALMRTGEETKAREMLKELLEDGGDFEGREQAEKLVK